MTCAARARVFLSLSLYLSLLSSSFSFFLSLLSLTNALSVVVDNDEADRQVAGGRRRRGGRRETTTPPRIWNGQGEGDVEDRKSFEEEASKGEEKGRGRRRAERAWAWAGM